MMLMNLLKRRPMILSVQTPRAGFAAAMKQSSDDVELNGMKITSTEGDQSKGQLSVPFKN